MRLSSYLVIAAMCCWIIALPVWAQSGGEGCGNPFVNHFGPYDYRTATPHQLYTVESVHFTPKVENLIGGQTTYTPGGDMAYTLHVFPNHHRALMALIRLANKQNTAKLREMRYSVACYFDRAERFAPNDAMVKSLHGVYLMQKGQNHEGAEKLEEALELAGDNANIHYNLGLAYFDLKDYDKALASAHKAYKQGFQFPGLRNKLERVGKWKDIPAIKPEEPAAQDVNPSSDGMTRP